MADSLLSDLSEGVLTLSFNRPKSLNALNTDMMHSIHSQMKEISQNPPKLLVFRGAGGNFMAGGDVKSFATTIGQDENQVKSVFQEHLKIISEIALMIENISCPTLSVVEGVCAGYGLSVVLASDFVISEDRAKFYPAYCQMGLTPDGGSSFFANKQLGYKKSLELYLLKDQLSSQEAKEIGIVNQNFPAEGFGEQVANFEKKLSRLPLETFKQTKKLFKSADQNTLEEQCQLEAEAFCKSITSPEFATRVQAFIKKTTVQS
jgi:2-(1,2-epoxy-1,2-dihydrophenyl)acetyl-CoA isomerase